MPLSMNFAPDLYPAGIDCVWNLYTTKGSTILFSITVLDLEGSMPSCSFDYIQVFDGPSQSYPLITKQCGRTDDLPMNFQSSRDMMTVRFRSDRKGLKQILFRFFSYSFFKNFFNFRTILNSMK